MIQIRKATFETNSSSTHSMVIAMDSDFEKWAKGEVIYVGDSYGWGDTRVPDFVTKEEFVELAKKNRYLTDFKGTFDEEDIEALHEADIYETLDAYCERKGEYLECDEASYITPAGEKVRIMCHYGYDG